MDTYETIQDSDRERDRWCGIFAGALLIVFFLFSSPILGSGQDLEDAGSAAQTEPSAGIPEKKEAATPRTRNPPQRWTLRLEMKKLEALIQLNDKSAEAFFNRARLYEYKGDLQKALQDYGKAIELDKGMKDAFYNRGLVFARMKKYDEALKDFSEVLRIEPSADGCLL